MNTPVGGFPRLDPGSRVRFRRDHIIDIAGDYEPGAMSDCNVRLACGSCGGQEPPERTEASDHVPPCDCGEHEPPDASAA